MTVQTSPAGAVLLEGECPSEDAEALFQHLSAHPGVTVDWRACESAHTAVVQVLMALKPNLLGPPNSQVLRDWVMPILARLSA
jgi:hypothetical protein